MDGLEYTGRPFSGREDNYAAVEEHDHIGDVRPTLVQDPQQAR